MREIWVLSVLWTANLMATHNPILLILEFEKYVRSSILSFHHLCLYIQASHMHNLHGQGRISVWITLSKPIRYKITSTSFASRLDYFPIMGIRLPSMIAHAKQVLKLQPLGTRNQSDVPKGHVAVYVGEIQRKRFLVPVTFLNHPSFQKLLLRAEEEYGFEHPMGGLTIPCREETFVDLTTQLRGLGKF